MRHICLITVHFICFFTVLQYKCDTSDNETDNVIEHIESCHFSVVPFERLPTSYLDQVAKEWQLMSTQKISSKTTSKPILAVDIDEVLACFTAQLVKFHNASLEDCKLHIELSHFTTHNFAEVLGCTGDEVSTKLDAFVLSEYFFEIPPVDGGFAALSQLKEHFDLHVVTARSHSLRPDTLKWLDQHYPGIFLDFHFCNIYAPAGTGLTRDKATICRDINAVALIDDNVSYAHNCANSGLPVYLFGDYPWNRDIHDSEDPNSALTKAVTSVTGGQSNGSCVDELKKPLKNDVDKLSLITKSNNWQHLFSLLKADLPKYRAVAERQVNLR